MAKDRKRDKPSRASALARQLEQMRAEQERLDRGGGIPPVPPDARRHVDAVLARRQETADEKWLAALRAQGEAGQAIEAIEAWVRDHLYDEQAGLVYAELIRRAAASPDPDEHERKALERFRDRSGLDAIKGAVHDYLKQHPGWDEFIKDKAARDLDSLPARRLPAGALRECAAIVFEAAVRGADLALRDKSGKDIRGLHRGNHEPKTLISTLAEDPATPPEVARRAADWAEYAYYGLWQLRDPVPSPGVEGVDLASGGRLYLEFPPGKLDGAAPWSVWLGGAVPVNGVWHVTGTGLMLSPREGDAIAEAVEKEVERMIPTAAGMPAAELGPIAPVNYDDPPPHGVRWEHFTPVGPVYGGGSGAVVMMLAGIFIAHVELTRAGGPRPGKFADDPAPTCEGWLDAPLKRLYGRTPREAAQEDLPYKVLLESMLRELEHATALALPGEDAADVPALRAALGPFLPRKRLRTPGPHKPSPGPQRRKARRDRPAYAGCSSVAEWPGPAVQRSR